jgi:hypothetical protein
VSRSGHEGPAHCTHCPGSHTGELPCLASATAKARCWLLIEHPGPWAEEVDDTNLPSPVAAAIAEARRLGVRPQLIRRSGRRRTTPPLQVYIGWSGAGSNQKAAPAWLAGRELADPAELAELDMAAVAAGRCPDFGTPVTDPVLLVCTHGRHNACCARTGAPLARALRKRYGPAVWETTHVGGDRYAANLVCLPHGLYYGDLGFNEAVTAIDAYYAGQVSLERLRGRAGLPEPAQAAEHQVRAYTGAFGVEAVWAESVTGIDPAYEVIVRSGGERYRVNVRRSSRPDSCGSGCAENRRTYVCGTPALLNEAALV